MKLLHASIIYSISDFKWVSPVQPCFEKGGNTAVKNDMDELIPTCTFIGWRMCIDYRRVFIHLERSLPPPFFDQMLER